MVIQQPAKLYQAVKDAICKAYLSHAEQEAPSKLPSDRALALEFHVSTATVAKALHELEQEGRVRRRVGAGTFVVPGAKTSATVGFFFSGEIVNVDSRSVVYGTINQILQRMCLERRWKVRHYVDLRLDEERHGPPPQLQGDIERSELSALVAVRADWRHKPWLSTLSIPVTGFADDVPVGGVYVDYDRMGELAGVYLRERGCRRPALVTPWYPSHRHYQQMRLAFARGVRPRDVPGDDGPEDGVIEPARHLDGTDSGMSRGSGAFLEIWQRTPRPDGVYVFTDVMAVGAIQAMKILGVAPGRDLHLLVHSNREYVWPELAALPQLQVSAEKIARGLADTLEEIIGGRPVAVRPLSPELYEPPGTR